MSTLLEQLIEAKICAALSAVVTGLPVIGFWQPAAAGTVKDRPRSCIDVTVKPRSCEGWGSDVLNLRAVVSIESANDDDPTGAILSAAVEKTLGVVAAWDTDDDAAAAALNITSIFRCDAVMFAPGGDCGLDDAQGVRFASVMVDIAGCLIG